MISGSETIWVDFMGVSGLLTLSSLRSRPHDAGLLLPLEMSGSWRRAKPAGNGPLYSQVRSSALQISTDPHRCWRCGVNANSAISQD